MNAPSPSPHRLVEYLTAITRCTGTAAAVSTATERVAEEFDSEVAAVVVGEELAAVVGFGRVPAPAAALLGIAPGVGTVVLPGLGECHTLAAAWRLGTAGRMVLARTDRPFTHADRHLLLGMADGLGLALDVVGALERERGQQRVLEVLLAIQRSIAHRAPLPEILAAVTQGASVVLQGCSVSLVLDDALDPESPIVAGADLTRAAGAISAPVHIHGVPAGALVAARADGAPLGETGRALLQSFAEHASLALADARTLEAMQEAFHDPLTGLPNRRLFLDRLGRALHRQETGGSGPTVLFVDLDRFKAVNDTLGHAAGDQLLRAVADRLGSVVPSGVTAARFGGDEFAVLLPDGAASGGAVELAERVVAALREPFVVRGKVQHVGASVGLAGSGTLRAGEGADELLSHADVAMYRGKAGGGGRVTVYDPRMRVELLARLELQAEIQVALDRGELAIHYQPIVDLASGRTTGLEALLRWDHPGRGAVSPVEFVPLAEATGAIVRIGRWVLDEACAQLVRWRARDAGLTMNVNVSAHQVRDPRFVDDVRAALRRTGLPGSALSLEITESVLLEDDDDTVVRLAALRALGLTIALDDFGTGYSSLGYLSRFPVDTLKIDRSFVSGPASATGGDQLVRTILELGRAYGLEVVAEGIEDDEQRRRLLALGCRHGQGYHFGRPADVAGTEAHLAAQRRFPSAGHLAVAG
jgi:diguanylate cyclase (GGDEF)-like protein